MNTDSPKQPQDYTPTYSDEPSENSGVSDATPDIITHEQTDDPAADLGVPEAELRKELDRMEGQAPTKSNPEYDVEDMREHVEDLNDNDPIYE